MTVSEASELFKRLTEEGKGDYVIGCAYCCESCQPDDVYISDEQKVVEIS